MAYLRISLLIIVTLCLFGESARNCGSQSHRVKPIVCPKYPCANLSPKQLIMAIWNLPKKLSPNVARFRDIITSLIHKSNESELALLLSQSLWAVDQFTGFSPSSDPSCTYASLINQTLAMKEPHRFKVEEMNEAIKNYGELCSSAIEFTIYVGLTAAGCPATLPTKKVDSKSSGPCHAGDSLAKLMSDTDCKIAKPLKPIIMKMSKSPNPKDRAVAMGAVTSATNTSATVFGQLMKAENLIKVLQMKSCNIRIPPECCKEREAQLRSSCADLSAETVSSLLALTKNKCDK